MTSPLEVKQELVDALQLDLIGPTGALGDHNEMLTQTLQCEVSLVAVHGPWP